MLDEKYVGVCSLCAEYPPYFLDKSDRQISKNLLYNPWCLFCDKKSDGDPTAFWREGTPGKFSYKCDLKIENEKKICNWSPLADIDRPQDFSNALMEHFQTVHEMKFADANRETIPIIRKEVVDKYLLPNHEE